MSDFVSLSIDDYRAVLSGLSGTEKQVDRASIAAVNGVLAEYKGVLAKAIAVAEAVPLKALLRGGTHGKGKRVYTTKAKSGKPVASIWIGYNPVHAAYLGRLAQNKQGARAGQHFFPGSFIATMRSGHRSVFHRVSSDKKSRIKEDAHELLRAEGVVAGERARMSARLADLFSDRLDQELSR